MRGWPFVAAWVLASGLVLATSSSSAAEDFLLAEGASWPGKIWLCRKQVLEPFHIRPNATSDQIVPRVQSLAVIRPGQLAFCSGLDRAVFELTRQGERQLQHGGYLVRQVRHGRDSTVFFSGLETPQGNNPLPDGFIYALNVDTGEVRTQMTFSQGDVGHDWWGAFDLREDHIYVGTLHGRTRIFDVSVAPVREIGTLPIAATAFRFAADGAIYACDGRGKLVRVPNLARPDEFEIILQLRTPFVDFDFLR